MGFHGARFFQRWWWCLLLWEMSLIVGVVLLMADLGQGWWFWFHISKLWVLDLWTLYGWTWKSIWLWVYGSISWICRLDLLEVSMLNVLEFSVLRLIMNVGRLSLSWFGEEHEVHVLKKKKNMKIINSHVLPKN